MLWVIEVTKGYGLCGTGLGTDREVFIFFRDISLPPLFNETEKS